MKNGRRRRGDFGQQTFIALGGVHTGPNLDRLIFFPRGGSGDFAGFADGVDGRPPVLFGGKQLQIDDRRRNGSLCEGRTVPRLVGRRPQTEVVTPGKG